MASHEEFEKDFSDYYEGTLDAARAAEVRAHIDSCETCRAEYAKLEEAMGAISKLHRMSAPQDFPNRVASTIHRRSAGRFFGPRSWPEKLHLEIVAIVLLLLVAAAVILTRWSTSGSVHETLEPHKEVQEISPETREAVPAVPGE